MLSSFFSSSSDQEKSFEQMIKMVLIVIITLIGLIFLGFIVFGIVTLIRYSLVKTDGEWGVLREESSV